MCGISGEASFSHRPSENLHVAMRDEMSRRGPDAAGLFAKDEVILAHRRLSILDLSTNANQPMQSTCGRYCIVFNGELYNHLDLRRELESEGVCFRTRSDTETILNAYIQWGPSCFKRFNGMFAIAIWDTVQKKLSLIRDRLGKKPMFFYQPNPSTLVFASELKALLHDSRLNRRIDPVALKQYLNLGYVLSSNSLIAGTEKLAPGTILEFSRHGRMVFSYWTLESEFGSKLNLTDAEATHELRDKLEKATRLRMASDVPVGILLSGGVDSAGVARLAQREEQDPVRTFTIGFAEKSFSELEDAKWLAGKIRTDHHDRVLAPPDTDNLRKILFYTDEPFADTSLIPTFAACSLAREHVTVALTGDGADELLGGYDTYLATRLFSRLQKNAPFTLKAGALFARQLKAQFGKVSFDYKAKKFFSCPADASLAYAHYFWRTLFSDNEIRVLLSPGGVQAPEGYFVHEQWTKLEESVRGLDDLDTMTYLDLKTWLVDDILVKLDRMSMACSLELRSPFLDNEMVSFALRLPSALKIRRGKRKFVLKSALRQEFGDGYLKKKKRGFGSPISEWLSSIYLGYWRGLLEKDSFFWDVIDRKTVQGLLENHIARKTDNGLKLFALLNFAEWVFNHLDGATVSHVGPDANSYVSPTR